MAFYLAYLLAFYLAVEVQRCALSWEGPRLRSSGAHWAGKVPGWGPAVRTELGSWRRAWRRVGKAEVEVEVGADMVEEKLEEEAGEEEKEEDEEEDNSSDKI